MITLEAFSELLETLYAAPLDTSIWGRFLDLLCEATGSRGTYLFMADSMLGFSIRAQGGGAIASPTLEEYHDNYASTDPYKGPLIRLGRSGRVGLIDCDELLPREQFLRSPMFQNIIQPSGLEWPGLMLLHCDVRRFEAISLWRTAEQGPMTRDANRLLELLFPHLRLAMDLRHALGVADEAVQRAGAVADVSQAPTLLVSSEGMILHANRAAEDLLRDGNGLERRGGALLGTNVTAVRLLQSVIRDAARPMQAFGSPVARPVVIPREHGRSPLTLIASPVRYRSVRNAVLVVVSDPDRPVRTPEDVLREVYGFTAAEIDIASGLLTGYSLEEIALLRDVAEGTVRSQLKRIFQKVGVSRQGELIKVLTQLPVAPV